MNIQRFNKTIQGVAIEASYYKNCVMAVRFFQPFKEIENTKLALLAQLIKDRNKKYPSKALMQGFRDNLYGASISSRTFGYGPTQVLEVRLSCISERFVDEPLQAKQLQGLADLIYQPLINQETLDEAKRSVADKINRFLENPMNLAVHNSLSILGEGLPLGLNAQGRIEDLEGITVKEMLEFHQKVILTLKAQMVIGGNFREGIINSIGIVFQYHRPLEYQPEFSLYSSETYRQQIDQLPLQQATLIEAYQTSISIFDPLYYALRIGNLILGQLPTSHLFQELREKHSLCYSVGSRIIAFDGLMLLTTSLDESNIEKASDLMRQQVNRMMQGDFTQQQIDSAKNMLISTFDSIFDDEYAIINFVFDCEYRGLSFDVDKHKQAYQQVTKEMVIQAFSQLFLVLQYQLKGIDYGNELQ